MPLPFFSLPHGLLAHQTQVRLLPGGLKVFWHRQSIAFNPQVMRFTGGVTATYGQTVVESDELEIHSGTAPFALATGHVALTDPIAKFTGDKIRLGWMDRTGEADNIQIVMDSVKATVGHIDLRPDKWTLSNVEGTGYTNRVAFLKMRSPKVEIVPGKTMAIRKPKFGILGALFGPFPDTHNSLSKGAAGFKYPVPTYRQDSGFGISWNSLLPVGRSSLFTASYGNYARTIPSYNATLATTFVKGVPPLYARAPRNELADRFDSSYFQNIMTTDPASDWHTFGLHRRTLALGTVSNIGAAERDDFGRYSKPWDLTYEQSDTVGGVALYGQVRAQQIRRASEPLKTRVVGWFSSAPKPIALTDKLHAYATAEGMVFSGTGFHWGRVQSGLTYRATPFLRISGAGFWGQEWGNPDYVADKLERKSGVIGRGDLITGPTQFSYLMKYEPGNGFYDREYALTQNIGVLQAYINYRMLPSQFRYGVVLRLDSILEIAKQRVDQIAAEHRRP